MTAIEASRSSSWRPPRARPGLDGAEPGDEGPGVVQEGTYDAGTSECRCSRPRDDVPALSTPLERADVHATTRDGDGKALGQSFCGICHSTTYITMQPRSRVPRGTTGTR